MLFPESFFIHFSFKNKPEHFFSPLSHLLHVFFASSQSIGFCHSSSFCMFSWFNSLFSCCWYYSSNIRTKINLLNIFTLNVQWIDRRPNEFSKKLAWLKCKYDKINKVNKWNKQMRRCECRAWNIKLMKTEKTGKENTKHAANLAGTQPKIFMLNLVIVFCRVGYWSQNQKPRTKTHKENIAKHVFCKLGLCQETE